MILLKEENLMRFQIMPKISVKQIKSPIGRNSSQRKILISLGLNKIHPKGIDIIDTKRSIGIILRALLS